MPSSDLPKRPWIYEDSRPWIDLGYVRPEPVDFVTAVQYDAEAIKTQMFEMITKARTLRLPLDGARLHLGRDVFDDLCRQVRLQTSIPGSLTAFWGVPLEVEEDRAGLVELRWTIRV